MGMASRLNNGTIRSKTNEQDCFGPNIDIILPYAH
jgi:hypothetical protein